MNSVSYQNKKIEKCRGKNKLTSCINLYKMIAEDFLCQKTNTELIQICGFLVIKRKIVVNL